MTQAPLRVLVLAALGATLLDAQALTVLPMPKGTNTLLGRVVEIGNDAPVSGAIVTVIGHFDASGKPAAPDLTSREMPPSLNLMTTADGYFVARNLPAGRFTVVTRAHGYMNNEFQMWSRSATVRSPRNTTCACGSTPPSADASWTSAGSR
jgi:hypothetical protein